MKKMAIILLTLLLCDNSYAQWTYESGGNDFDGKYRTSYVQGSGGEYPYDNPYFVVNLWNEEKLNIYLTGVGYLGCDNNFVRFRFSDDDELYSCNYSELGTNKENDQLYIYSIDELDIDIFLKKLKQHSYISIRVGNDCFTRDYRFILSGSTKAINYALGNFMQGPWDAKIIDSYYPINIFTQPDTESEVFYTLEPNTNVLVLDKDVKWSKISYENKVGYVMTDYLRFD